MDFGLAWLRRRLRSLSRWVLVLFCAAWLQAAVVPCVMAHGQSEAPPIEASDHDGPNAHGGHAHAATATGQGHGSASDPCAYCPPGASGDGPCDGHGGCAYPHDPQVDARAGAIFVAVPVPFFAPLPEAARVTQRVEWSTIDAVPRTSLSVSYCRFLE